MELAARVKARSDAADAGVEVMVRYMVSGLPPGDIERIMRKSIGGLANRGSAMSMTVEAVGAYLDTDDGKEFVGVTLASLHEALDAGLADKLARALGQRIVSELSTSDEPIRVISFIGR